MPCTMGYIRRSVVIVLFVQLFGRSEPKTIVYNSYSSNPIQSEETRLHNATEQYNTPSETQQQQQQEASESSGRAFSSGGSGASFPFSIHPDFLTKPVQVARPNAGYKSPKYIVYPSYSKTSPNSAIPYYNAPVAMDRFAPGEAYGGTIYKLKKQKQSVQSVPFGSIPAASFNSPVSVPSPGALRGAASDNSPVSVMAPSVASSDGPSAPSSSGMQDKPMFMPTSVPSSGELWSSSNSTEKPSSNSKPSSNGPPVLTSPGMQDKPIFMPTPVPTSDNVWSLIDSAEPPKSNSTPDSSEIILFPPNSHTGYLPPANKSSVMKRPTKNTTDGSSSSSDVYKPASDLYSFPPNTNASYLPPPSERSKHPVTSYLPPPSGDITGYVMNTHSEPMDYEGSAELFKFPPNVNSGYLPPAGKHTSEHTGTSYGAPPSGDPSSPSNSKLVNNNEWVQYPTASLGPNELHRFPPNTMASYLPPDGKARPMHSATSYIPPPSGDPHEPANMKPSPTSYLPPKGHSKPAGDTFRFPPNIHSDYLPPVEKDPPKATDTSYLPPPSGNPYSPANSHPPKPSTNAYIPPADLFKFPPNVHSPYLPPTNNPPRQNNAVTSYLPPASGIPGDDAIGTISVGPGKPQYLPPSYSDNGPPMSAAPASMSMMPNKMPPMSMGMMQAMGPPSSMDGPPTGPSGMDADYDHHHHDHDHHSHDHHHDFPYFTGFDHDHYPDVIFDHDHDHYHHHHEEPTTTPPPPPPPPVPETPRLKNYSYYYLSRTLWYVPLYFTLYFTFYVAILIIRSIARHKVNLPNQWVGNTRSFGSIRDLSDKETQQKATMMATFAMKQIEDFREKYL
ncbi:proline-rich extensin-like protein EPR1 [Anopheles stephensi]|uniref:proline-rich extensin-like protein EPR1 n=1 Tax=Anopheles stephensi TaxID=30069 RepID=UPI001658B800|nr:proline-rich extensin-like protein EPR1 [Anopheles stephensi]